MRTSAGGLVAAAVMVVMMSLGLGAEQESTAVECTNTITGMTGCLPYATGKAGEPTADCCKVVKTTVQHNKDCLCTFIGMVHQGSAEVTSLGIQEAKLIQLPSACRLANVSASNCPKLAQTPSSSPILSNGKATVNAGGGYKLQAELFLEAIILVAIMGFLVV